MISFGLFSLTPAMKVLYPGWYMTSHIALSGVLTGGLS